MDVLCIEKKYMCAGVKKVIITMYTVRNVCRKKCQVVLGAMFCQKNLSELWSQLQIL